MIYFNQQGISFDIVDPCQVSLSIKRYIIKIFFLYKNYMIIIKLPKTRAWIIKDQATGKNISAGIDLIEVINDALKIQCKR